MSNFQDKVGFIWDLADLLRGVYKKNDYQKIILPFVVLKRFDCILEYSKSDVLEAYKKYKDKVDEITPVLMNAARDKDGKNLNFFNYSEFNFQNLLQDPSNIEANLNHYLNCFSKNVKDIFINFNLHTQISRLAKADLLFFLVQKFSNSRIDLHPEEVSNHEMGSIFEELIRKFSEQSNEEAGEHFTPREVVDLMTSLMFALNGDLQKTDIIKTVYDPACGTGGMLTSTNNFIKKANPESKFTPSVRQIC